MTDKTICFTRHAEAEHNVALDYSIPDAPLTPLGRRQSVNLNERTTPNIQITADLLVSSPLRRTLQTVILGFSHLKAKLHRSVILLPQLQEVSDLPCDTGSDRDLLESDLELIAADLDFSNLTPDWNSKQGIYDPRRVQERAQWVRLWLRERPEKEIVVVAHGDILRNIVEDQSLLWDNAEVKFYTFASLDDRFARLVPIPESPIKGGTSLPAVR